MSYLHDGKKPVVCKNNPIDPDSIDWVYFALDSWLRANEAVTTHVALVEGGTVVVDSTYLGSKTDADGNVYAKVYGIKFSVLAGAKQVTVTLRTTTSLNNSVDLGRTNIDHSVIIPVISL